MRFVGNLISAAMGGCLAGILMSSWQHDGYMIGVLVVCMIVLGGVRGAVAFEEEIR